MSLRRNAFWAIAIGLMVTLFWSVGFEQTVNKHFWSWANWPNVTIDSAWVRAWRFVIDVLGVAIYPMMLAVGAYLGWLAVHSRAKPLGASLLAALLCPLVGELASGFGQDGTKADVQNVSPVSVVVVLATVVVPLAIGVAATRKPTEDPPRTAAPLFPDSTPAD